MIDREMLMSCLSRASCMRKPELSESTPNDLNREHVWDEEAWEKQGSRRSPFIGTLSISSADLIGADQWGDECNEQFAQSLRWTYVKTYIST